MDKNVNKYFEWKFKHFIFFCLFEMEKLYKSNTTEKEKEVHHNKRPKRDFFCSITFDFDFKDSNTFVYNNMLLDTKCMGVCCSIEWCWWRLQNVFKNMCFIKHKTKWKSVSELYTNTLFKCGKSSYNWLPWDANAIIKNIKESCQKREKIMNPWCYYYKNLDANPCDVIIEKLLSAKKWKNCVIFHSGAIYLLRIFLSKMGLIGIFVCL